MLTYVRRLLFDEGAFLGLVRSALVAGGLAIQSGAIDVSFLPNWVGFVCVAAGMLMRSTVPVSASTATTTPTAKGDPKL